MVDVNDQFFRDIRTQYVDFLDDDVSIYGTLLFSRLQMSSCLGLHTLLPDLNLFEKEAKKGHECHDKHIHELTKTV